MADRDNPKTHIENQKDADLPREQPLSPQHEGIDPLTEGDTMYPNEDTKAESEKLTKKTSNDEAALDEDLSRQADTVDAQGKLANSNDEPSPNETPNPALTDREEPSRNANERTEPVKADGKVQPQTKTPAKTNDSDVAAGSTEPKTSK